MDTPVHGLKDFTQRLEQMRVAAALDAKQRLEHTRATVALDVAAAQRAAEEAVANATIRRVLYTHDNRIASVVTDMETGGFDAPRQLFATTPGVEVETPTTNRTMAKRRADLRRRLDALEADMSRWAASEEKATNELRRIRDGGFSDAELRPLRRLIAAFEEEQRSSKEALQRGLLKRAELIAEIRTLDAGRHRTTPVNAAVGDLHLDHAETWVYWGRWADPFTVSRFHLQNEQTEVLFRGRSGPVTSVALLEKPAGTAPTLFWIEGNDRIMSAPVPDDDGITSAPVKDGDDDAFLLLAIGAPDRGGLWQLVVDEFNLRLYWTNTLSIWRVDLEHDGEGWSADDPVMVISPSESPHPIDLAVDGENRVLVWIDRDLGMLRRSDLDGNRVDDLCPIARPFRGIDLDPTTGFVYWGDEVLGSRVVRRGRLGDVAVILDGSNDWIDLAELALDAFTIAVEVEIPKPEDDVNDEARVYLVGAETETGWQGLALEAGVLILNLEEQGQEVDITLGAVEPGPRQLWVSVRAADEGHEIAAWTDGRPDPSSGHDRPTTVTRTTRFTALSRGPLHWQVGGIGDRGSLGGRVWSTRMWRDGLDAEQLDARRTTPTHELDETLAGWWVSGDRVGSVLPNRRAGAPPARLRRVVRADRAEDGPAGTTSVLRLDPDVARALLPVGPVDLATGLTFEAWIRVDAALTETTLLELNDGADLRLRVDLRFPSADLPDHYQLQVAMDDPLLGRSGLVAGAGRIEHGTWTHVAVSLRAHARPRLFVDGAEVGHRGRKTVPDWKIARPRAVFGGPDTDFDALEPREGPEFGFRGAAAEVRLWAGALGGSAVRDRLHRRLVSGDAPLLGAWSFDDGKGLLAAPSTGPAGNARLMLMDPARHHDLARLRRERRRLEVELGAVAERRPAVGAVAGPVSSIATGQVGHAGTPRRARRADGSPAPGLVGLAEEEAREHRARLAELDDAIESAIEGLDGTGLWERDDVPLGVRRSRMIEASDVLEVPGLDGLAISFTSEYAAAQRAHAQTQLRVARETAEERVANARRRADARRASEVERKAAATAQARAQEAGARRDAAAAKAPLRQRQHDAEVRADADREDAKRRADATTSQAMRQTSEAQARARDERDTVVRASRRKRDAAAQDLAAARRERAAL